MIHCTRVTMADMTDVSTRLHVIEMLKTTAVKVARRQTRCFVAQVKENSAADCFQLFEVWQNITASGSASVMMRASPV